MSNLETIAQEILCGGDGQHEGIEFLPPREVPLGGLRAMPVGRTAPVLPNAQLRLRG
ncbi:hypothetical protein [Arthrobacter sp. B2a2-09]|uniref:hypothetical protein n=1 Tax=Arthrobacter sp. B2a2-09 TaxID=2952822 RepID=UPI0022CD3786|nr:hypothetical protein [Arthrobacter sp. B2a2-09]MCZ9881741.1 hypothetical protein [Arthrobacter sp. B2a2-09]